MNIHSNAAGPARAPAADASSSANIAPTQQYQHQSSGGGGGPGWRGILGAAILWAPPTAAFALGTWQLQRREEKVELLQRMSSRLHLPPLIPFQRSFIHTGELPLASGAEAGPSLSADTTSLGHNASAESDMEYRRVVCEGEWDREHTMRVGPRVRRVHGVSEKGYVIITPLLPKPTAPSAAKAGGSGSFLSDPQPVLVNRGWAPEGWSEEGEKEGARAGVGGSHVQCPRVLRTESVPIPAPAATHQRQTPAQHQEEAESTIGDPSGRQGGSKETRGWVSWAFGFGNKEGTGSAKSGASELEEVPLPAVTVLGILRGSERPNMFVPVNSPEQGLWFFIDAAAMAKACGLPEGTLLVEAMADNNSSSGTDLRSFGLHSKPDYPWPRDEGDLIRMPVMPQDHLNYAFTWYALSLATSVMAYMRLRTPVAKAFVRPRKVTQAQAQP